jgi:hypothetical protein
LGKTGQCIAAVLRLLYVPCSFEAAAANSFVPLNIACGIKFYNQ